MTEYKDTTSRHLRHKLQSLSRRLDELEEATSKLQKAEDELLDLQDKIIQAEGSNSSLLGDVEVLRKRVLKIEGKDEEVRKAEDLCRLVKEKLEEEENLTKELRAEIEHLQNRMTDLEKLEEAFGKSKSDCTQLGLSLNEEKNLTRKLSSELDALKARVKEVDSTEARLSRTEQTLTAEMEKLKGLAQTFVVERKRLLEKQREDEKLILKLTEKLERQKAKLGSSDHSFNESRDLWIEEISDEIGLRNKSENEKNSLEGQEDNKIKDLTQEIEKLKSRLKQMEMVEEDLKNTEFKNVELAERFQQERSRNQALSDQVEQLKTKLYSNSNNGSPVVSSTARVLENGKAENEEINVRGGHRPEKPKPRSTASPETVTKFKTRDISSQQRKLNKDLNYSVEYSPKTPRRALSPAHMPKKPGLKTGSSHNADNGLKGIEEKLGSAFQPTTSSSDNKKVSVLSRYPPAANDQKPGKASIKPGDNESKKLRVDKFPRLYTGSDWESSCPDVVVNSSNKIVRSPSPGKASMPEFLGPPQESVALLSPSQANGSCTPYRTLISPTGSSDLISEGHSSASETESMGLKHSVGERDTTYTTSVSGDRTNRLSRHSRQQGSHSGRSSSRSSFEEEQHRTLTEGGSQEPITTSSGIEIQRVCSPREAFRSKAVIKPAIVEYDRKEIMSGGSTEPPSPNGKSKMSTKPNKMTSSITFYPNDPGSSRTSSRSSSISSEPSSKERHTSTSNIVIGPSADNRGSISIPYEISILKSDITLRPGEGDSDCSDPPSVLEVARVEATVLPRSSFQSPETISDFNDTESGFESSCSSNITTTVTSWKSHSNSHHVSQDDSVPEMRNVTVRGAWRNRGATSVDEMGQGLRQDGLEDELESTTTWRAYRATTILDTEETLPSTGMTTRGVKPTPAEVYMRRISNSNTSRDALEPLRRNRNVVSPVDVGPQRSIPHEPVTAQEMQPRMRKPPVAVGESNPSPASWRKQAAGDQDASERPRGRGPWPSKGRTWTSRHLDN